MSDEYPFTWAPLSEVDDATVKRCFGDLGKCRELVRFLADDLSSMIHLRRTVMVTTKYMLPRSKPEMMRVTPSFANHCQRVRDIKVFS